MQQQYALLTVLHALVCYVVHHTRQGILAMVYAQDAWMMDVRYHHHNMM